MDAKMRPFEFKKKKKKMIFEPQNQKRTFGHLRPAKIQTAHSRSLIRIFTGRILIAKDAKFFCFFFHADNKGFDQTA